MFHNTPSPNRSLRINFSSQEQAISEINGWNSDARNRLGIERMVDRARAEMDGAREWGRRQVVSLIKRHAAALRSIGLEPETQPPRELLSEAGPESFQRFHLKAENLSKKLQGGLLSQDRFDQLLADSKRRFLQPTQKFISPYIVGVRIVNQDELHKALSAIHPEHLRDKTTEKFVSELARLYQNEILAWGLGKAGDSSLDLVNHLGRAYHHFDRLDCRPDPLVRLYRAKTRGFLHAQILLEDTGIHNRGDNESLHPRHSFNFHTIERLGSLVLPESSLVTSFSTPQLELTQRQLRRVEFKWHSYLEAFLSIPRDEKLLDVRERYRLLFLKALDDCQNDIQSHPEELTRNGLRAITEDTRKILSRS